jgi:cholesterol oxidase
VRGRRHDARSGDRLTSAPSSALARPLDYDWVVVGSGFGGSVAALRLSEKGYRVCVLEAGRRFEDSDHAETTWNLRRFLWLPKLGCRGIQRITFFKDLAVLSGAGVGGGSLVYATTLYRAPSRFFRDPQWAALADWKRKLAPHYDTAERMLGATRVPFDDPADRVLRDYARGLGVESTHTKTTVGVYFGDGSNVINGDPYFGGDGPPREPCVKCGKCMIGCRFNAKNTLPKNYLYFAERRGARIVPDRSVVDVAPLGAPDGSDGYSITHRASGRWVRHDAQRITARGVVFAAGALGTNQLLQNCRAGGRAGGSLPRLSSRLGYLVRTNSEALVAVTANDRSVDFSRRLAITGSIHPDPDTHIETVSYGDGGGAMSTLFTLLTGNGTRLTRPLAHLAAIARKPRAWLKLIAPRRWSQRTIILLVMQTLDNSIRLRPRNRILGRGVRLQTEPDPNNPSPTYIKAANAAAERIAKQLDGIPQSSITEALANIPATAHILGGAVIGKDEHHGVIDTDCRVYNYDNLLVCDGAAIPANPGVNPSLTITALAEHAISRIPTRPGERPRTPEVRVYSRVATG